MLIMHHRAIQDNITGGNIHIHLLLFALVKLGICSPPLPKTRQYTLINNHSGPRDGPEIISNVESKIEKKQKGMIKYYN